MSSEILAVSIHPSCLGLTVDLTRKLTQDHSFPVASRQQ
jgi:hypothetical protein